MQHHAQACCVCRFAFLMVRDCVNLVKGVNDALPTPISSDDRRSDIKGHMAEFILCWCNHSQPLKGRPAHDFSTVHVPQRDNAFLHANPKLRRQRYSRVCPNDIVAIAASINIIVFMSIDEKTAGRRASRKISYLDGLQFADAKRRELHAIFICVFALSLCRAVVAEQPLPPTAVVGFRSEAGVAKDRSPAANIDADCALIGLKEMPITPVDAKHHALEVARGEISGLAVERAALI